MVPVPEELRPEWDHRFPGRLAWELERLQAQASNIVINQAKLAEGIVEIDLTWTVRGADVPLRATFPTSYPFMRPHVQLRTDPATWPRRHISPVDGSLCLLGRDPTQWRPDDGLAGLLMLQLEAAVYGGGAEDPQGESAEYWWNQIGLPDSYCLVDSDWDLGAVDQGTLDIKLVIDQPRRRRARDDGPRPAFQMVVTEMRDIEGGVLASWSGPVPYALRSAKPHKLRWFRCAEALLPLRENMPNLIELRQRHLGGLGEHFLLGHGLRVRPFVFLHPVELTESLTGNGWLIGIEWGSLQAFVPSRRPKKSQALGSGFVPVYRAGPSDLGSRVPAFSALSGKKVALIGVGALGAPVAIDLARNGAAELCMVDHDVVEPGNSVRWPLGAACWGRPKVEALRDHIEHHYPRCKVIGTQHAIGGLGASSDSAVLRPLLQDTDVVIDASASAGVNQIIWDLCQQLALPLVKLGATPDVKGGTVMVHAIGGACPNCLNNARHQGMIARPAGERDAHLIQPPGCGERTFVGADFDLQELSLQAVRCAINVAAMPPTESTVYTLSLRDTQDQPIPPAWVRQVLEVQPECSCHVRDPN